MADDFDMERYLKDRDGYVREWEEKHGKPKTPQLSPEEARRLEQEAINCRREAGNHHPSSHYYQQYSGRANNALSELQLRDPASGERVAREAVAAEQQTRTDVRAAEDRYNESFIGKLEYELTRCRCRCHSDPNYTACGSNCCGLNV
ncbi:MAG: hypothetical protein AAB575_03505 [Patescibacteria group bacterium]